MNILELKHQKKQQLTPIPLQDAVDRWATTQQANGTSQIHQSAVGTQVEASLRFQHISFPLR